MTELVCIIVTVLWFMTSASFTVHLTNEPDAGTFSECLLYGFGMPTVCVVAIVAFYHAIKWGITL